MDQGAASASGGELAEADTAVAPAYDLLHKVGKSAARSGGDQTIGSVTDWVFCPFPH